MSLQNFRQLLNNVPAAYFGAVRSGLLSALLSGGYLTPPKTDGQNTADAELARILLVSFRPA